MTENETEVADALLGRITDANFKFNEAVNAYREFMAAAEIRARLVPPGGSGTLPSLPPGWREAETARTALGLRMPDPA